MSEDNVAYGEMTSKDYYSDSYAHFAIHEEMLKDEVRTMSYYNSIMWNRDAFKNKVVLDVGCGTGILSMIAAQAGAKLVIGIDMSNIIDQAKVIVEQNGLSDKVVLIKGKMEEVKLPVDEVDIIVSEWMGYFLLYESMLETVLYARDRYLKKGGLVLPDVCTLYVSAIEDGDYREEKVGFWNNVYGFDYSSMKEIVLKEPLVDYVNMKACVTQPYKIKSFNIAEVKKEDLEFTAPFELHASRNDSIHAFLCWFDCSFGGLKNPVSFSTGPHAHYTHWKQTVFYLGEEVQLNAGDTVRGELSVAANERNKRDLDISISYTVNDFEGSGETRSYRMN